MMLDRGGKAAIYQPRDLGARLLVAVGDVKSNDLVVRRKGTLSFLEGNTAAPKETMHNGKTTASRPLTYHCRLEYGAR